LDQEELLDRGSVGGKIEEPVRAVGAQFSGAAGPKFDEGARANSERHIVNLKLSLVTTTDWET